MGYDAGKKVKGRKIHVLVDGEGLPMRVVVQSAAVQDRDGAGSVLDKIRRRFPWLGPIWADGGHNAWQVDAATGVSPRILKTLPKPWPRASPQPPSSLPSAGLLGRWS